MQTHAVFIQLPVQEPDGASAAANVPLAAACLAAYAEPRTGGAFRFTIAPREVVDSGGDAGILGWIESQNPDILAFTLYLWNRERSLRLAAESRRRIPGLVTIAGGPETALLGDRSGGVSRPFGPMDAVVAGEGEEAFLRLLRDHAAGRRLRPVYHAEGLLDLEDAPNPYLSGHLAIPAGGPVYLETMRGCPNNCSYCYYGKAFGKLRSFPETVVGGVFAAAAAGGAREIYIMDPSFNAVRNMEERLRSLAVLNTGGIPLHTEIRLESVTPARARLLREAGFRSVEAGLQSVRPEVLRSVRRSFNRPRFEAGARLLPDEGIEVRTGVILGLPGDTQAGFRETLDFVEENGLTPGLEVYPLAVLPGTELRDRSAEFGLEYMPEPPYWVLSTRSMSGSQLAESLAEAEKKLGIEYFRPVPPRFSSPPGWTGFADLGRPGAAGELASRPETIASDLTLLVPGRMLDNPADAAGLTALGGSLLSACPYTLYKLVIMQDDPLSGRELRAAAELAAAFLFPGHPANRTGVFRTGPRAIFSVRLFQLTRRANTALGLAGTGEAGGPGSTGGPGNTGTCIEPVFLWEPGALTRDGETLISWLRGRGFVLCREDSLPAPERSLLRTAYREHPAMILRLNEPPDSV